MPSSRPPRFRPPTLPEKSQYADVIITGLDLQARGVALMPDGSRTRVPGALPGEKVQIAHGEAESRLVAIGEPSPERALPPCPHFGTCGGCATQHMTGVAELAWKTDILTGALAHHGLEGVPVRPALTVPPGTRRRITLAAARGASRHADPVIGFNARGQSEIVDVTVCPVTRTELVRLLPLLRATLAPWIRKASGLDIGLTWTDSGVDILITGSAPDRPAREALIPLAEDPAFARLSWRPTVRAGAEPLLVVREPVVTFAGVAVAVPPGAFLQPSREGEDLLLNAVACALDGEARGKVADLFAGCGTFSLPLVGGGREVVAVEGDAPSLDALRQAGAAARLKGLVTLRRDLFRDPLTPDELNRFQAVIFDPPRAGAAAQSAELARSRVPVIVAVSCNAGTLARDLQTLVRGGYQVDWVQPVNQFLWSTHGEAVARLSRPGRNPGRSASPAARAT